MGAGLKKDLRVSRVGPGGSLNAFFFFSSESYFTKTCQDKEEGGNKHTWRAQHNRRVVCCVRLRRMNRSRKESIDSLPTVGP
ncbi:hypothetical protein H5410_063968 [Solanum commersonii]|uniref:Uncharacterized protein n=1 Tax=Solanum commersonii TaxID=4109 RepID=A0A9J5W0W3_SOLCO|nr:hypothetical protein H5410_063968 [Solanum commersonii]